MVAVTVADNKTLTRCSTLYCSEAALVSVETLVLPPEMVAESVVDIFQHSADTAAADPGPAQSAQAALGLAAGGLTLLTATLYPRWPRVAVLAALLLAILSLAAVARSRSRGARAHGEEQRAARPGCREATAGDLVHLTEVGDKN